MSAVLDTEDEDGDGRTQEAEGPGRAAGAEGQDRGADLTADDLRTAARVTGWVLAGYLTPAAIAVVYASGGPVRVDPLSVVYVLLFSAVAAACGAWGGCGSPGPARWLPGHLRAYRGYGEEAGAALRVAGIAAGVLLCGGALIGGASLLWHAGAVGRTYAQLSGPVSGQIAVLLLALGLVPNFAVWAASYALGVGFGVGAGSAVAPAGASGYALLPGFPLLAALPGAGTSWIGWTTLAVPVASSLSVAWLVGNGGRPPWSTVRVAAEAALALGVGCAVLAAWSGGALGTRRLADFGPTWWLTGPAAFGWTLVVSVPVALVLRYHLAHPPTPWRTLLRSLRFPRVPQVSHLLPRPRLPRIPKMPRVPNLPKLPRVPRMSWRRDAVDAEQLAVGASGGTGGTAVAGPGGVAVEAATPFPGLLPPPADPLPWPSAPPLPYVPPLPDLPPSAPPPPPQDPLPAEPPAPAPPAPIPPVEKPPAEKPPMKPPPVEAPPAPEPPAEAAPSEGPAIPESRTEHESAAGPERPANAERPAIPEKPANRESPAEPENTEQPAARDEPEHGAGGEDA